MPLTPIEVGGFGPLNLRDDPARVGWDHATNILNASLSVPGRLSTRGGYTKFNTSTPANAYSNVVSTRAGGTEHLVGFRLTNLDKIDAAGVVSAGAATLAANFIGFQTAEYGSPTLGTLLYIADWLTGSTLQKWNGATLANSSGKPTFVAVSPWDNRLVQACYLAAADTPSAANGSQSTVFFSDAGAPDTYTSTSWVQLHPGDGEVITGMVAWRDELFVFKETACFVFYGTGTESDGTPKFLYRRVSLPSPVVTYSHTANASQYACAAGPDAVYFHAADGIYATTGGPPVSVSDVIRGIFSGTAPSSLTRSSFTGANVRAHLTCVGESIYLSYQNTDGDPRVLVYDRPTGIWTVWSIPANASPMPVFGSSIRSNSGGRGPFIVDDVTADFYYFSDTATTDNGTTIAWSYTSGYEAPAKGRRLKLRGSSIYGYSTNAVTLQIITQAGRTNDVADTGSAVTLGTSPTVAEGKRRHSARGALFAHKLSGTGPATITRLTHRFLPPQLDS